MSLPDIANLVTQGIAAFNAGDRDRAYALLVEALHADPHNEAGWLWMSGVVQESAERRYCLERVVEINPQHAAAQRGLAKLPADLVARSPLPTPKSDPPDPARCTYPGCTQRVARVGHTLCHAHWIETRQQPPAKAATPADLARCTYPGCTQPVARAGHTLCRAHWKETRQQATSKAAPLALLNAAQLGDRCELSSQRINLLLAELGWIERKGPNWYPTAQGQALGAVKRQDNTGIAYVVWPEQVLQHRALQDLVKGLRGESSPTPVPTHQEQTFRKRFPAEHRTTDGHLVRSKAEMLIDNWLYMAEIVHAYERRLPIEEEVYCDFYIPAGKVDV